MGEPRPCTPPSGPMRQRRNREALESPDETAMSAPASVHGSRNIRRRIDFDSVSQDGRVPSTEPLEFHVYLPNRTSVEFRVAGEKCAKLTVQRFVELVRNEMSRIFDPRVKQKQRDLLWGDHVHIEDFHGKPVEDCEFALGGESKAARVLLLYDGHPDTVHAHSGFWNVTPEPQMLGVLPQDYTLFSALADEVDNSLQAVFQLEAGKDRLICVNIDHKEGKISIYDTGKGMDGTPQNCISKWGTIGSSMNRHSVVEAIGGQPPYLKPNFGMYGFGGIGAGLHLGGIITVSSKTEASQRVAILHLGRESLTNSVKAGSIWKTGGEFRSPTGQELQWSRHGSFTMVEISDLSRTVTSWKVEEVQRKLKDFYFPYIQNDEGYGGTTDTPVEIRVNGEDLAGIVGGAVAHSNFHSSRGEPYVIILEFTKPKDTNVSEDAGDRFDKANARITCHYFPINKGGEAIDDIIKELKKEDSGFSEDFESFSRRSIRRLGRLLPDAGRVLPDDRSAGRLPFMEPKRIFREKEVNRHCYKRVKAFIDVDAGFVPTTSKMDLVQKHPFTTALLELGLGLQTVDSAKSTFKKRGSNLSTAVTVSIKRNGAPIRPQDLHADYTTWITQQHESFDTKPVCNDGVIIQTQDHHKQELNIRKDVFRVVYDIKCKDDLNWKVGKEEAPKHLKLLKGLPGLNNNDTNMYVTVECFLSDGLPDEKGETKIICRPIDIPEDRGSRVEGNQDRDQLACFILGESRCFPIEILFTDKYKVVEADAWQKRMETMEKKLPERVELLNEEEVLKLAGLKKIRRGASLKAGDALETELVAVVRTNACMRQTSKSKAEGSRLDQKYIFTEPMEMKLDVWQVKPWKVQQISTSQIEMVNPERKYETKTTASTRNGVKGLYCFRTAELETFLRTTGTYVLIFSSVSVKYKEVKGLKFPIVITPSSKIGHWKICSHSGICSKHHPDRNPEVMKVRLGEALPGSLYLTRVDEFSNPMEFTKIITDILCDIYTVEVDQVKISITVVKDLIKISDDHLSLEIPKIELGGGKLELLKQTMRAVLKMRVDGTQVADFSIAVLPGRVASARMKDLSTGPILKPGQVIEHIIFEVLDNYQNPASSGEQVTVLLEGFDLRDKIGYQRSVDGNGCLDLGLRLCVTAGYGETARVELRSMQDLPLWDTTFHIIDRKLRIQNDNLERVAAGSQLKGIMIEAVDEDGQVDETMDGVDHILILDWNTNIAVPLQRGRCTLPSIQIPPEAHDLWKGRVTHTHHPELQILITVAIEESETGGGGDECMVSEDPFNVPGSFETPVVLTNHPESRALRNKVVREVPRDNGQRELIQAQLQAAMDHHEKLAERHKNMKQKAKKCDTELLRLKQAKEEHEARMKAFQGEIDVLTKGIKLEPSTAAQPACDPTDEECTFGCTQTQMAAKISKLGNPPGTHAAAIFLKAQDERHNEIKNAKGIIGIVSLLGAVEKEEHNRALVEFLGLTNMLTIVCESTIAAEALGIPPSSGVLNKSQGLLGFAKNNKLKISGRYRVITLDDESSFYKGLGDGYPAVNNADPQKPLNIVPASKPGQERLVGSLGYAVNMIHLNEHLLKIRILGHGLRESLFYVLFGYLEVFDTANNMLRARNSIRTTAVSLDGGLIRKKNQYELGSWEDPEVWFPAVQQHTGSTSRQTNLNAKPSELIPRSVQHTMNNVQKQLHEVKRKRENARQMYFARGTEQDIQTTTEKLRRYRKQIADIEQQIVTETDVEGLSNTVVKAKRIAAGKIGWS